VIQVGRSFTVGIDLSKRAVKVAATQHGRQPRFVGAAVQPLPEGVFDAGVILDPPAAVEALRAALRTAGLKGGQAVVGMAGRSVVVRQLTMPPMPLDELKNAIKWDAERQLPIRIEEAVLDVQVLRDITDEGQRRLEVLVAAVPERDAMLYFQIAEEAGLDVAAIEVAPLALTRLRGVQEGSTAVIDIGAAQTDVVVIHEGVPVVVRTILIGVDALEAEATAGGTAVQELVTGITRSFDYFQTQVRGHRVERVVVTGDAATDPALIQTLTAALEPPVEVGNPLIGLATDRAVPPLIAEQGPQLAVAIGLSLRAIV
jgi:type IV pilus assembly protein PilM